MGDETDTEWERINSGTPIAHEYEGVGGTIVGFMDETPTRRKGD